MSRRPDPLTGLSARERRQRITDDVKFLMGTAMEKAGTQEAVNTWKASSLAAEGPVHLWDGQSPPAGSAVFCARVDLDTPIFLADNIIVACADCDCDIQVRPDSPAGIDRVCISCGALRVREEAGP